MPFLFLETKARARDVAPLLESLLSTHEGMGSFLTLHKTGRGDTPIPAKVQVTLSY